MLQDALYEVTKVTFNRVSVDGDTSTNDTCCILASGAAENQLIDWKSEDYDVFYGALKLVCTAAGQKDCRRRRGRYQAGHLHRLRLPAVTRPPKSWPWRSSVPLW